MAEEIGNRRNQIVVWIHEAARFADDPVPVCIGIISKRDIELLFHPNQSRHRVWRRAVHSYFSVPIGSHEAKGWIDDIVDDSSRDAIAINDGSPKVNGR